MPLQFLKQDFGHCSQPVDANPIDIVVLRRRQRCRVLEFLSIGRFRNHLLAPFTCASEFYPAVAYLPGFVSSVTSTV